MGCSTGRSAGFAPLRILSMNAPARRYKVGHVQSIGCKHAGFHCSLANAMVGSRFLGRKAVPSRVT